MDKVGSWLRFLFALWGSLLAFPVARLALVHRLAAANGLR